MILVITFCTAIVGCETHKVPSPEDCRLAQLSQTWWRDRDESIHPDARLVRFRCTHESEVDL